jgi:hypothetical protein
MGVRMAFLLFPPNLLLSLPSSFLLYFTWNLWYLDGTLYLHRVHTTGSRAVIAVVIPSTILIIS